MFYKRWHDQTVSKLTPPSEVGFYFRVTLLGLLVFAATYSYTAWLKIPGTLNKSVADTSIILIGLSMLLTSICYFWDFLDSKIIYRKHLGLIGFAFGLVHIGLSFPALKRLFEISTWQQGAMWPALTGAIAAVIFAIMTLISNRYMATELGGRLWRAILRTGYLAIIFVWLHVVLLKYERWLTWFEGGMQTLPSMSLLVSIFMFIVVVMRVALWWSLRRLQKNSKK
jgi:DMSO/TMAO reductase YedYZ heme-binding membrane subunit